MPAAICSHENTAPHSSASLPFRRQSSSHLYGFSNRLYLLSFRSVPRYERYDVAQERVLAQPGWQGSPLLVKHPPEKKGFPFRKFIRLARRRLQNPLLQLRKWCTMTNAARTRRTFRWPGAARELVRTHLANQVAQRPSAHDMKLLVTKLVEISGNPRKACWRFVRTAGLTSKRNYRQWTKTEQQKLLDLIASHTLPEVTLLLRRSTTSVRAMLHRLGASARMGEDWFTKHALAEALHVRSEEVQKWIDRGWLRSRVLPANGLKREVIDADEFCQFCKQHRSEIVGRRLNLERLSFVQNFVFPPSHIELLAVREAKREQAAYDRQRGREGAQLSDEDDALTSMV